MEAATEISFFTSKQRAEKIFSYWGWGGWGSVELSGEIKATLNFGEFSSLWLWLLSPGNVHRSEKTRTRKTELQEMDRVLPSQGRELPLYSWVRFPTP